LISKITKNQLKDYTHPCLIIGQ